MCSVFTHQTCKTVCDTGTTSNSRDVFSLQASGSSFHVRQPPRNNFPQESTVPCNPSNVSSLCLSRMEDLPDLVLDVIAANLSGSELAAWCAVSRGLRDRLNQDDFWQHRCDSKMADYLSQTPNLVQPIFSNPHRGDTGLSHIGKWRLSYMRETHLWNNWRNNRHHSVILPDETNCFTNFCVETGLHLIYKNEFMIVCDGHEIQLWRVQQTAVKICVRTLPSSELVRFWDLSGDCLYVKQSNQLQIYEISIAEAEFVPKSNVVTSDDGFLPLVLVRSILVEVQDSTMQVWNVETGEMLKEEERENTIFRLNTDSLSVSESYFAIIALQSNGEGIQFFVQVYKLPDVVLVLTSKLYDENIVAVMLVGDFIFINAVLFVDTYCLKTSQHFEQINITCLTNLERSSDSLFFGDFSGNLVKLTPCSEKVEVVYFQGVMNRPARIKRLNSNHFLLNQNDRLLLVELTDEQGHLVKDLGEYLGFHARVRLNEAKTKLFTSFFLGWPRESIRVKVCSFW